MSIRRPPSHHVRSAARLELARYRSIGRWAARRPDVPQGATPFGYAQLVAPMLWLFTFGSVIEVVVIEVVLRQIDAPWADVVRLPVLVVSVWVVLWMIGMTASYRVRPHLLLETQLRIRNGPDTRVDVPLDRIASVHAVEHEAPGILKGMHQDDEILLVGVNGRTNLEIRLDRVTELSTSAGTVIAGRVGFWVDDPRTVRGNLQARTPDGA